MPIIVEDGAAAVVTSATGTAAGVTLTVSSEAASGRMRIVATGGTVGTPLYVIRRDLAGSSLVRETYAGTILWLAGTPTSAPVLFDYESRQGLATDYTLTNQDGLPLVTVRLTIPEWGTWLKSPGKPHLNVSCLWAADQTYQRASSRTVIPVRGAKFPIIHSEARTAPAGDIRLLTTTAAQDAQMASLLSDGSVLMVDVPERFGVPVRYVSVGQVTSSRPSARTVAGERRYWSLGVDEVSPPVGLPTGQGFTYTNLQSSADSYISLAARYLSYDTMTVGETA